LPIQKKSGFKVQEVDSDSSESEDSAEEKIKFRKQLKQVKEHDEEEEKVEEDRNFEQITNKEGKSPYLQIKKLNSQSQKAKRLASNINNQSPQSGHTQRIHEDSDAEEESKDP
jgi:adenine C2-methylase RlmN of 23S rRNA A2503 and tRNA A37